VAQHGGLDLAGLDAVAVDLDLAVAPADEFERAVGQPAREVAGAVQPVVRGQRRQGR
jgi:hypothetical protein